MKIYVFGNADYGPDKAAVAMARGLRDVEVVIVKPNEDVPFVDQDLVVIMDVVEGIKKIKVFTEDDLDKLVLPPRGTAHDYDLGFQLKYLKKLGKIGKVRVVGLPMNGEIDEEELTGVFARLGKETVSKSSGR